MFTFSQLSCEIESWSTYSATKLNFLMCSTSQKNAFSQYKMSHTQDPNSIHPFLCPPISMNILQHHIFWVKRNSWNSWSTPCRQWAWSYQLRLGSKWSLTYIVKTGCYTSRIWRLFWVSCGTSILENQHYNTKTLY